jgi:hypothetical protein
MPTYYMLSCYGTLPGTRAQVAVLGRVEPGWNFGARLTEVSEPVEAEMVKPGEMVSMFHGAGLLMTDPLVDALKEAGVDNLDTYQAVIRDPKSNRTWTNYKAVNIIGVVSCADMAKSNTTAPADELIDVPFEGLAIDDMRAGGALMFRLAEAVGGIVVHEKVRAHLQQAGFNDLRFHDPAVWVG